MNLFVGIRIFIALVFLVSGSQKLIEPLEKFLYVVQSYELTPAPLDWLTAFFFPWAEFLFGLFLLLGLWLKLTLRMIWAMLTVFILVVGQALIRGLPITECGCFGDFVTLPLHITLLFDLDMWVLVIFLMYFLNRTSSMSLDDYFAKNHTLVISWPWHRRKA